MRILAIEDDPDILGNIASYLGARNYIVDCAMDGMHGYTLAAQGEFDVIILDLALPRLDGYELCRRLREDAGCETPLIMVTARDTLDDRLTGFHAGADDYLIKPFALAELGARVKALMQRPRSRSTARTLQVGDLVLDIDTRELTRAGQPLRLPPAPMTLLKMLMKASPAVVARSKLEESLWLDSPPDSDSLRTHIHQLRQVIDKPFAHALLHTVHGVGYQLRAPDTPADDA
ncbi:MULTISPECIES: response regulator transcription factor [unclassified Paraburkholderia]|uniref:response regulator transcription factor n=1 Tax=unclassified Paraburkholderia TaxID=2615204 RepID=UPI001980E3DA|nr:MULTISPECIES: response regulator transcription factor [unclassified Paraburkholderia]MBN3851893.1 response regulator transcription factor [Paraburkholderia sp. Ac-20340]